ncbi:MAG: GNAT family N-acetyltransferase [Vicinamibacteraceae bacterium]|nr:GNAT family N-acetyltransferase [Vicinamibacteraceae bacterium]
MPQPAIRIASATPADAALVLRFIRKLAEYERLAHTVVATEDGLREVLSGEHPQAEVLLAYADDVPVGFALFFHNFSTFMGRHGLYLEDLFVEPAFRGSGIGKALLVELARIAVSRGCARMEWAVLDWNEPAIGFYKRLGAVAMDEWTVFRLTGEPLAQLARNEPG